MSPHDSIQTTNDHDLLTAENDRFTSGTLVRLAGNPSREGTCTGQTKKRPGAVMVQVRFGNAVSWYPDFDLESIEEHPSTDEEILRIGRFGRADELRRQLTHIQLSGGLADLVYSMGTTNTDFYAHQYKPVLAFLESPSHGLLIADEVGLGKTIEAGLIWTEMRARDDARRLLVVCPKMLCDKWRLELRNRFGVEASIVDAAELAKELEQPDPQYPSSQALIASMQGIRPPREDDEDVSTGSARERLATILRNAAGGNPILDLVIIDEAHYMRNPQTATHYLGELLRDVTENIVLLSATPINLRSEDLFSLLNIVDPDNFRFREQFELILRANEPLVRARRLALSESGTPESVLQEVEQARRYPFLSASKQLELIAEDLSSLKVESWGTKERVQVADRLERVNALSRALIRTRKADVTERRVIRHPMVQEVVMQPAERSLYDLVTSTIKEYAWIHSVSDGFLLATPQRQLSSCIYAAGATWANQDEQDEEEQLYEDIGLEANRTGISEFRRFLLSKIRGEYDLEELYRYDSKFESLSRVLIDFFREFPEEKVVLFSYFRPTLRYLAKRFAEQGIESCVLMGGMVEDKSEVIDRFATTPSTRILLSSEVASEGVDLQFCRFLVNYDLPWNPMKVEQRIGRIDRLGQRAERIDILNLVYADTIDSRIVQRLYERLNLFERALGALEALLGESIQQLTAELLTGRLTPEQEEQRIAQTAMALENNSLNERNLEEQAGQLIAHSDYILQKVHAAKEFSRQISNEDIRLYVKDYLERYAPGYRWVQVGDDPYEIDLALSPEAMAKLEKFVMEKRLRGMTRLTDGGIRRCRFANKVAFRNAGVELLSQFHPLVRFISSELASPNKLAIGLMALQVPKYQLPVTVQALGIFAFTIERWTFRGLRTEEVVRARVVNIDSGEVLDAQSSIEIVNAARLVGTDWPGATGVIKPDGAAKALEESGVTLAEDFESERDQKSAENDDRVRFQVQSVEAYKKRKVDIEQQRIANLGSSARNRGLVIAAERKIDQLEEKFKVQLAKIEHTKSIPPSKESVGRGIIRIWEGE